MRTRGFGGLADTITALKNAGVDVWVIGQSTEFLTDVSAIAQRNGHSGGADAWPLAFDRGLNAKLRKAATGATFVDPLDFLCKGEDCTYRRQGQLIYADYGHFSPMGSAHAVLDYFPLIRRDGTQ